MPSSSSPSGRSRRHPRALRAATAGFLIAAAGALSTAPASAADTPPPDTPTSLSTSPATSCADDTVVGDGNVTLYAVVSDPDGDSVGGHFQVWRHDGTGQLVANPTTTSVPSGSTAAYSLPKATLESAAGGAVTEFAWKVQATDSTSASAWSVTCHFSFDPTHPGAPVVSAPENTTIGQPATVAVAPPSTGTVPSGYSYQLDGGGAVDVTADATGHATLTVTPTQHTNTLAVTSLSAGGNFGGTTNVTFNSAPPPPEADGDLTGDNVADLLTVGGQHGLPSGLWLAAGQGTGHVSTTPTDIGANGNGFSTAGSPSDFDGSTAITGHFTGSGTQDVLVYYPGTGGGAVYPGYGNGAVLNPANENTISAGTFQDANGDNPVQLVNAGNTSGGGTGYPDLLGVTGDSTNGFGLELYPASGFTTGYGWPVALNAKTPDGGTDWNDWTVATAQLPTTGGGNGTAMFLWKRSTGELDLWENLTADPNSGALAYTAYPVATGWNTGTDLSLRAADINGDGTPDLWTVGAGGTVTGTLLTGLSTTAPATLTTTTDVLTAP